LDNLDYSNYTLEELYDVERNIDAQAHPQRYREILSQIQQKKSEQSAPEIAEEITLNGTSFYDDPIAKLTGWEPLVRGGSNFATHTLDDNTRSKLEFKPSFGSYLVALVVVAVSAVLFFKLNEPFLQPWQWPDNFDEALPLLIPVLFAGFSIHLIYKLGEKIVFDKKRGIYWKGHKKPGRLTADNTNAKYTRFDEIHAIQLLTELCDGGKSSDFYSFELNLVLKNGKRLSVIDHGNKKRIRSNCDTLAKFLSVPVWEYKEVSERSALGRLLHWKF